MYVMKKEYKWRNVEIDLWVSIDYLFLSGYIQWLLVEK